MNQLFKTQVFEIIRLIPAGRVTRYSSIGKAVGFPNHSRQVGNVLSSYDSAFQAHKVCNSSGMITAVCLEAFIAKLESKGVKV